MIEKLPYEYCQLLVDAFRRSPEPKLLEQLITCNSAGHQQPCAKDCKMLVDKLTNSITM